MYIYIYIYIYICIYIYIHIYINTIVISTLIDKVYCLDILFSFIKHHS